MSKPAAHQDDEAPSEAQLPAWPDEWIRALSDASLRQSSSAAIPGVYLRLIHGRLHIGISGAVGQEPDVLKLLEDTTQTLMHTCEECGAPGEWGSFGGAERCFAVRCELHRELNTYRRCLVLQIQTDEAATKG